MGSLGLEQAPSRLKWPNKIMLALTEIFWTNSYSRSIRLLSRRRQTLKFKRLSTTRMLPRLRKTCRLHSPMSALSVAVFKIWVRAGTLWAEFLHQRWTLPSVEVIRKTFARLKHSVWAPSSGRRTNTKLTLTSSKSSRMPCLTAQEYRIRVSLHHHSSILSKSLLHQTRTKHRITSMVRKSTARWYNALNCSINASSPS